MTNPYLSDTDVMASLSVEDTLETRTVEKQEWIRLLLTEAMIKARKSAGLTQKQLAKLLGKTQGWVSKLENANNNHELESIVEYLTALDAELLMMVRRGAEVFQASQGYSLIGVPKMVAALSLELPKQTYSFTSHSPSHSLVYSTNEFDGKAA